MTKFKIKKINIRKLKQQFKDKPVVFSALIIVVLCLGVLFGGTTLLSNLLSYGDMLNTGYTEEVKEITFASTGYDNDSAGGVKVTKSAEWTGKYEATIRFDVDTNESLKTNTNKDIILVLDTSVSMTEERVKAVNDSIVNMLDELFTNTNNRVALITFNTTATKNIGFTNDKQAVIDELNSVTSEGATNYYLALKKVEELLSSYSRPSNTETHMIFITDGYPTEGTNSFATEADYLKSRFSYLIRTAIQFELGDNTIRPITEISDYQYYSSSDTIEDILIDAYRSAYYYNYINITDYIESEYFVVESKDDIEVTHGTVSLTTATNGNQSILWKIPSNTIKSGTIVDVSMSVKAKVQEEYRDDYGYLPTNTSASFAFAISGVSGTNTFTTSKTPVLKTWYEVNYDANVPSGCSTTYTKNGKYFPFFNVIVDGDNLTCAGYQFKGWSVVEPDTRLLSDTMFEMPSHDVTIGGTWTKLSIAKSMEGEVYEEPTFYNYLKANAVRDDIDSQFVVGNKVGGSKDDPDRGLKADVGTGINYFYQSSIYNGRGLYMTSVTADDEYPILVFRGNIDNNNVLFANKCWKAVVTTKNGGVKLLYNGVPTNGTCSASGTAATIGTSAFNSFGSDGYYAPDTNSLADAGYVYGERYLYKNAYMGNDFWPSAVGLTMKRFTLSNYTGKSLYYSNVYRTYDVSASHSTYPNLKTFTIDQSSATLSTNPASMVGKYTQFNTKASTSTSTTFSGNGTIYYILYVDSSNDDIYVIEFNRSNCDTAGTTDMATYFKNIALNKSWYYANDVTYENGVYKLQNYVALKPVEHGDALGTINGDTKLHYTCMYYGTTSCSKVAYVFWDTEGDVNDPVMTIRYLELTDGKKMEDAVDDMIGNPSDVNDSDIKTYVDNWYVNNIKSYESMLETTEFEACNNRKVYDYGGWHKDGDFTTPLEYEWKMYSSANTADEKKEVLACRNQDVMSIANGKLDYPIALLNSKDAQLAGATGWHYESFLESSNYIYSGVDYWILGGFKDYRWRSNPARVYNSSINLISLDNENGYRELSVRPVVALKNSVYATGTGTASDPYVIKSTQ